MAEIQQGIYDIEEIAEGAYKIYEQRAATMYLVCGRERACLIDTAFGLRDLKALNDEQIARLELYTNSFDDENNCWYEMINGRPCFQVEYLLYNDEYETGDMTRRTEMNGYYNVFVNVEDGTVEEYEYNSSLAGLG